MLGADDSKHAVGEFESFLKNGLEKKLETEVEKWKNKHSALLRKSTDDFKHGAESFLKKELGKKLKLEVAKLQKLKKGERSKRQLLEIQHLPNETLIHICQFLSLIDLNNVSAVSRRFNEVATNTYLHHQSLMTSLEHKIKLTRMLDSRSPRFRKVSTIKLSGNVSLVSASKNGIIGYAASEKGDLGEPELSDLLKKFTSSKLKHLQLDRMDLTKINYKVLANAINRLEAFSSEFCMFSSRANQVTKIFRQMSKESTKIKSLKILSCSIELLEVPPLLFARAVNKLESLALDVNFRSNSQHKDHLFEMFTQMYFKTNLKRVHLLLGHSGCDITVFPAKSLAEAVSKLEEFVAPRIEFSIDQIKCILTAVSKESSKIRKLDLGSTYSPRLINVDIRTLTKVINKTEMNNFKVLMSMRSIELRNEQILKAYVVSPDLLEIRKRKMEGESLEIMKNMPKAKNLKKMVGR